MSLDYNLLETIKLLFVSLKFHVMISIIISSIIMTLLFILNKESKRNKIIISIINIILIICVLFYYFKDIVSFKFSNPINNIYFYFFNTIIYLILSIILIIKNKYKITDYIIYGLSIINILFSLFITSYLKNQTLFVIGNIFPMIKFGNIIYISYYIYRIIVIIKRRLKR